MILGIFGAGGQGKEVLELAQSIAMWDEYVFVDDVQNGNTVMGVKCIGFREAIDKYPKDKIKFVIALGDPSDKEKIYKLIVSNGGIFDNVISKDASVSKYANIGKGVIIKRDAIVSPEVTIGDNTTIQAFTAIGHGATIGNHCQISTHSVVGGNTVLGDRVFVGFNSPIKEKLQVGSDSVISAGAVVLKDVPENVTVMGNPARVIGIRQPGDRVFK